MRSRDHVTYLGKTTFRNRNLRFGIRQRDRLSHMYVVGKTGTGKSTLIHNMAVQDFALGNGIALFDPHGSLAHDVLKAVPLKRKRDVNYLNVPDPYLKWAFNPLHGIPRHRHAFAVAGFVDVFRKLWSDDWGPRLEHLLRNVIFTLLEISGSTLSDVTQLLTNQEYRKDVVRHLENEIVRDFWLEEFDRYSPKFRAVVVAPLQNKLGALLTDPTLYRILTGNEDVLDLRKILDEGKILIVNLDKGKIGEGPASVLGSFLLSHIALAGLSRSDTSEGERKPFYVYLDEFHTFTTLSLATMLSELRKYAIGVVAANQYLSQMDTAIQNAIFGNVGTILSFRIGAHDASFVAREFSPDVEPDSFINLPRYNFYVRLMINGVMSSSFSGETLPPL